MINCRYFRKQGSELLLINDAGEAVVPLASEVFGIVFGQQAYAIDDDSELTFSRYPLDLRLILEAAGNAEEFAISCTVAGYRHGVEVVRLSDLLTRKADHIISGNTWYPFMPGALEALRGTFTSAAIVNLDRLTLRQCLALSRQKTEQPLLETRGDSLLDAQILAPRLPEVPTGEFRGQMYPYQADGVRWLSMLCREGMGGILGDQMGLGKTIQIIALIAAEAVGENEPSLVIAPATLLENWRREFVKFAPGLGIGIHRGPCRTGFPSVLRKFNVIITSYETALSDATLFNMVDWNLVVLDEAQAIKNPDAQRTRMVKKLRRRVSIAVTGTPMENRLVDLWSLIDFAVPGYLGTISEFEATYLDSPDHAADLEPVISPLLLRRKVSEVAQDLPERIDIPQPLVMDEAEIAGYERIRQEIATEYGTNATFVALVRLRQFCTHPFLLAGAGDPAAASVKYRRLMEIVEEIIQNAGKAIIFTSYTGMIDIFIRDIPQRFGIPVDWIDGRVEQSDRQPRVDRFNGCSGSALLVLNPKAAGTGLNITGANHVIHYNLEWNPALEDQASARAHRRGQTRCVTVHRLFYEGTVEEVINDRVSLKRQLAEAAVVGVEGQSDDYQDLLRALSITPDGT